MGAGSEQCDHGLNRMNAELTNNNALTAWGQDVEALGNRIQSVGQNISSVGDTLTKAVTAPIVAGGVASVKLATSFEDSLAEGLHDCGRIRGLNDRHERRDQKSEQSDGYRRG